MLYLVGLGLTEKDVTLRALEVIKKSRCYFDGYTSIYPVERLERLCGKKFERVGREFVESCDLVDEAGKTDVALLVPGDPLSATTHISLVTEAAKKGVEWSVIPGVSVFSAISLTGLQLYKFGMTASIPRTGDLSTVKKALEINRKSGLHTLLLPDVGMGSGEAAKILMDSGLIAPEERIVVAKLPDTVFFGPASGVPDLVPASLVVPGELHFAEREYLEAISWRKGS